MDHPSPDDLLRSPLLAGLSPATREALAARLEVEDFVPGSRIIAEGRPGYSFHVIDQGTARVTQDDRELRLLGPGDFFGEISILGAGRRTASVVAVDALVVWTLFGTEFRVLQTTQPEVAAALEAAMRDRLATG